MSKEVPAKEIIEFIYDRRNKRKGVFVAQACSDDIVRIGFSLCSNREGETDVFDREKGLAIARQRMFIRQWLKVPNSITNHFVMFTQRTKSFFKNKEVEISIAYKRTEEGMEMHFTSSMLGARDISPVQGQPTNREVAA